ncbi:hypothetical protein PENTCL1PPCAC_8543, partial [Pristionchus entomophagus]
SFSFVVQSSQPYIMLSVQGIGDNPAIDILKSQLRKLQATLAQLTQGRTHHDEKVQLIRDKMQALQKSIDILEKDDIYESLFEEEFTINGILGFGGSGIVFEAKNHLDEATYAVKRIAVDPKKVDQALTEVRAMAQLDDPDNHIIRYNCSWIEKPPGRWQHDADVQMLKTIESREREKVSNNFASSQSVRCLRALNKLTTMQDDRRRQLFKYDNITNCQFIFIQLELCNASLATWLENHMKAAHRPLLQSKLWFRQIVKGVEYIHSEGLIHRDLKPCNILFNKDKRLKIADMGIVIQQKIVDGVQVPVDTDGWGTQVYMSPEQRSWIAEIDAKSDVFTLGLILTELCVVMNFDQKVEVKLPVYDLSFNDLFHIFDYYRAGRQNKIFVNDTITDEFTKFLTHINFINRPTCSETLVHQYLAELIH